MIPLDDRTRAQLDARLAREQADARLPSVVAGIVRGGVLDWTGVAGSVDGQPPSEDTQYRIGSITKTMVAVGVMRLRDEGLVDLSAPVDRYVSGAPAGITVAQCLAHASGITAESSGDWWERTAGPAWEAFVPTLDDAPRHEPGSRFHYSNVGFALLGRLVAEVRGRDWFDVLRDEVFAPLGMRRTSQRPQPPAAQGLAVHPYADVVLEQPEHHHGAMAPAGQLWCSHADLARWAAFLAGDTAEVLAPDTLEEMARPRVVQDLPGQPWTFATGLGLQVWNVGGRRAVGHGGSMPGFLALCRVDVRTGTGVVVQTNTTWGMSRELGADLLELALDASVDAPAQPWAPVKVAPELLELAGTWFWGPRPYTLRVLGEDELSLEPVGPGRASRFRRDAEGRWIGLDDYYAGERLEPVRVDGEVTHLDLASFVFTRVPYEPGDVIPGGRDDDGWHAP